MKVLVAGGAGFIGTHLCRYLLDKGNEVICLDNLLTGKRENIEPLLKEKRFSFLKIDITKNSELKTKNFARLDAVIHLASPASPLDYQRFPIQTLEVGSIGTKNLLELSRKNKSIFLLASTSEIYGDPEISPQSEDYWGRVNPVGLRSVYDESKRFAEAITSAYERRFNLPVRIARIFNTYGPLMKKDDGRVIPNFINQALSEKPLTIFGDGSQTRSFCYISDMIKGLYKLLLSDFSQPVNLGNPEEISIKELAKITLKLTGSESRFVFKSLPIDDPKRRCPDIKRAKEVLDWQPKVGLEEGLKRTISFFKNGRI